MAELRDQQHHTLSVLVENRPGVLTRCAGLFARRGFNIDSLAVGTTQDPLRSRITIRVDCEQHSIDQVIKQLYKLVDVLKVQELDSTAVELELLMIKVASRPTAAPRSSRWPRCSRPRSWTSGRRRSRSRAWPAPTGCRRSSSCSSPTASRSWYAPAGSRSTVTGRSANASECASSHKEARWQQPSTTSRLRSPRPRRQAIGVIGYGSQGHAHALNNHDSGNTVVVGARPDSRAAGAAAADGLQVETVADATARPTW